MNLPFCCVLWTDEPSTSGVNNLHSLHEWALENPHATRRSSFQQRFGVHIYARSVCSRLTGRWNPARSFPWKNSSLSIGDVPLPTFHVKCTISWTVTFRTHESAVRIRSSGLNVLLIWTRVTYSYGDALKKMFILRKYKIVTINRSLVAATDITGQPTQLVRVRDSIRRAVTRACEMGVNFSSSDEETCERCGSPHYTIIHLC
jgi:hypothetical protein